MLNLSLAEKEWLAGRIGVIDLQSGCPHQCLACGVDAPSYAGEMPLEDFMELSQGIREVRENEGIELLIGDNSKSFAPFWASDPVLKKDLPEVVKELWESHGRETIITTSGWPSGDNFMQRNMEELKDFHTIITYSLKSVTGLMRADYDKFLLKLFGEVDGEEFMGKQELIAGHIDDFLENSRYVQRAVENMKTLGASEAVGYSVQYMDQSLLAKYRLPEHNRRYAYLLSHAFVKKMLSHCRKRSGVPIYNLENEPRQWLYHKIFRIPFEGYEERPFGGSGRAVTEMGMKTENYLNRYVKLLEDGLDPEKDVTVHDYLYNIRITHDSTLNIHFGYWDTLSFLPPIPREWFLARAQHSANDSEEREKLLMLADLQGRCLTQLP